MLVFNNRGKDGNDNTDQMMEGPSTNERDIMENQGTQFFSKLPFPLFIVNS